MQLKLLKSFFSKTMFKGREIDLNFCTTQKRSLIKLIDSIFRYGASNLLRNRNIAIYSFLFWGNAKSAPFSIEFRDL